MGGMSGEFDAQWMSPKEEQNCHCREPGGAVMAPSGVQGCGHMVWLQRSREWEVGYVLGF
jgi:hypothetical protein